MSTPERRARNRLNYFLDYTLIGNLREALAREDALCDAVGTSATSEPSLLRNALSDALSAIERRS